MINKLKWMIPIIIMKVVMEVVGHGRLIEPPSRASMWRYGFNSPPNYNDHELYCGGFNRQWQTNGGKCGICGDAWDAPQPRAHEAGGKYGQGIIVRKYKTNSKFTIRVELTANHRGYFEFRLCPNNAPKRVASQQCLDKYVLKRAKPPTVSSEENFHETRFYPGSENKIYEIKYLLPHDLTCTQCVLQWKYIAGNNWGTCSNGTGAVGCGPQEEFRACADISIQDVSGTADETPYGGTSSTESTEKTTESVDENTIGGSYATGSTISPADTSITRDEQRFIFVFVIGMLSLLLTITILALLYLYYYYANSKVEEWWTSNEAGGYGGCEENCWTTIKSKIQHCTQNDKQMKHKPDVPIPPPRIKKNSVGQKDISENLV